MLNDASTSLASGDRPLRILIAHNRYQQPGGEDGVVEREAAMLVRRGHLVEVLTFDNDQLTHPGAHALAAVRSFYSRPAYRRVHTALASFRPDLLHVHNFMPSLSPAVFFAAQKAAVPVVQTLHNYRLLCANALLFRAGAPCEECIERNSFLPGIQHACYRQSRVGSAVVGGGMAIHARLGTWSRRIHRYIALSSFAARKFSSSSRISPSQIHVKPNFVPDRGVGPGGGGFALFVGRVIEDKGLQTILSADAAGSLPMPVYIAGDGPFMPQLLAARSRTGSRLIVAGRKSAVEVEALMKQGSVLVVPSLAYEGFPLVMVEALSVGLPIVASRIGGLPEIAEEGASALYYKPGDAADLCRALRHFTVSPEEAARMRTAARALYLERYTEEINYAALSAIYRDLVACFI